MTLSKSQRPETQWRDMFEVVGDYTLTHLLDQVMLQVMPRNMDPDEPELVIGKNPEFIEEDGELYLLFDRFYGTGDWRGDVIPFRHILHGRTGPSLERRLRWRFGPFH